jgi:hypothetical protein
MVLDHSLAPLLKALPEVKTLIMHAVVHVSRFTVIAHDDLLPRVKHIEWAVEPDGLQGCIDLLSSDNKSANVERALIWCHGGGYQCGFKTACIRFLSSCKNLQKNGIRDLKLFNWETRKEITADTYSKENSRRDESGGED